MALTGLLSDGGWLALAIFRHSDHTDVIVNTRLQSIHSVFTSGWQNKVLKEWYTVPCHDHRDLVTGDGCGVER